METKLLSNVHLELGCILGTIFCQHPMVLNLFRVQRTFNVILQLKVHTAIQSYALMTTVLNAETVIDQNYLISMIMITLCLIYLLTK